MERSPRYCFCYLGGRPWAARPADRYCALCGQELLAVLPLAAVLSREAPVRVALYLHPQGNVWAGMLSLKLAGRLGKSAHVRWSPQSKPAVQIAGHRRASSTLLELSLQAPRPAQAGAGPLGRARLSVTLHGQPFPFTVEAFGLPQTPPRAWLALRPGEGRPGGVLVLPREAAGVTTFLQLAAGPGVPVQFDTVRCDHPATTVALLHEGRARSPGLAEVRWDPARLRADREEIIFRLTACGLPEIILRQSVRRERMRAVRFHPATLVVDCLAEDNPQARLVCLTNADSRPLVIRQVEPNASWLADAALPGALPLRLAPGASTTLRVDLHLHEINGVPPPYEGQVVLDLAGRGRQPYPVRVESVRSARRLASPLLLDPGPPRVVLARRDEESQRLVYLPCSGDGGIDPEELGLDRGEYAAAVFGERPAEDMLRYLVAAARARCRVRDLLDFACVRLCRHPWVPVDFAAPGVTVCGWAAPVLAHPGRPGPAPDLLRMDLWNAHLVDRLGQVSAPLLEAGEQVESAGAALVRWLAREFTAGLSRRGLRVAPALGAAAEGGTPRPGWLRLACDALVLDSYWGPVYAWRRLCRAAWVAVPELGQILLDLPGAQRQMVRAVADYAQQVCVALVRRGAGEGPAGLAVLGPLSGSPVLRRVLRSILTSAGFRAELLAAPWVAWLAPAEWASCGSTQPDLFYDA